jgi:uncharacterized protein (DUF2164 family)
MAITLSKDAVDKLKPSLKRFFDDELELELSDLKMAKVLDYVLKEIGPLVYNQAIKEAEAFVSGRLSDLEATCYEKEFTYWTGKRS